MVTKMIQRFVKAKMHGKVTQMEGALGVESPYLHFIVDTCIGAFFKFILFTQLATHRKRVPSDASHLARILTSQSVDCGTCVQVAVNLALAEDMRPEWIEAALEGRPEALPEELRDVYTFTGHVLARTHEEGELREVLRARYGNGGLVDLAYAIAGAQVFPMLKQVLGYATTCSRVEVAVRRAPEASALAGAAQPARA